MCAKDTDYKEGSGMIVIKILSSATMQANEAVHENEPRLAVPSCHGVIIG